MTSLCDDQSTNLAVNKCSDTLLRNVYPDDITPVHQFLRRAKELCQNDKLEVVYSGTKNIFGEYSSQACQLSRFYRESHGLTATQANLTGSSLRRVNTYQCYDARDADFLPQRTKNVASFPGPPWLQFMQVIKNWSRGRPGNEATKNAAWC